MLNTSDAPVFLRDLAGNSLVLSVPDEKGSEVNVNYYGAVSEITTEDQYKKEIHEGMICGSFPLIAGCGDGVGAYMRGHVKLAEDYGAGRVDLDKGIFDRDLFRL